MQSHQRYVPLTRSGVQPDPLRLASRDVLRPEFLLVGNGLASADAQIRRGNERVLSARLADAEFFLNVDRKQPSADRRAALSRVTFASGSAACWIEPNALSCSRRACDGAPAASGDWTLPSGQPISARTIW